MKFNDYQYQRPDMEQFKVAFEKLLKEFSEGQNFEAQDAAMVKINDLRNEMETMMTLVSIRHSVDTTDAFYEAENDFIDENGPVYQGLVTDYYKALVASPFKKELKDKWGNQIFTVAELAVDTFKPEILELLQKENKLGSEYVKLRASAKIMFEGEERNLSQMGPFTQSMERQTRYDAHVAICKFYEDNESEFDRIYDEMVKVRHEIANKLGYENFVELGYKRLLRSDYDAKMVKNYRDQILEHLVPLTTTLYDKQAKRLKLDTLSFHDESLRFLTGNAKPQGKPEWIIEQGKTMYAEMSKETDEFFSFMLEHHLMDLEAKKGKAGGGYCTFIPNYKAPFIFSNFNGTSGDVDVLTHEAGHAFQVYSSREYALPEYIWPTLEACEIHSMSMEFFAWPWMEHFFKHQTAKYKYSHLTDGLLFIPYGVTVDEFQHFVYENPNATPEERKAKWAEIEKKYLPHRTYDNLPLLERGAYWYRQGHIFSDPFYYIDYTLAQVCAYEFWHKSNLNREKAWEDYLRLCQAGGSKSFLDLLKVGQLNNPFENGSIKKVVDPIQEWLKTVDDENL
ncbi:MAG: M3 family oligoendopeptidase [Clostridia bacterium]|nr:M3 family oligoendopeptidase [Clostridia bacterium]